MKVQPAALKRYTRVVRSLQKAGKPVTRREMASRLSLSMTTIGMFLLRHPEYERKWGVVSKKQGALLELRADLERAAKRLRKEKKVTTVTALAASLGMNRSVLLRHFKKDQSLRQIVAPYLKEHKARP